MHTRYIAVILFISLLSACSSTMPAPFPTETAQAIITESTVTDLPPIPAIAYDADTLRLWGDKDASVIPNRLGKGAVYDMALSPDGKTIAVTGLVSVSTYDFVSLQELWMSLQEPSDPPISTGQGQVVWSPDGNQLVTTSEVGKTVWDAKTGEQLLLLKDDQYAGSATWTQDGKLAIFDNYRGTERFWDVQTREELFNVETKDAVDPSYLMKSDDLSVEVQEGAIIVWDTRSKQQVYPPLIVCDSYCIQALELSPDGTRIAVIVAGASNQLGIWDLKTGEQLFSIESRYTHPKTYFSWSPDGKYLAAFDTSTIRIVEAQTGNLLQTFNIKKIEDITWSVDGESLITLSQYESLTVWNVKTGEPLRPLSEHTSWAMNLAWSPDGSMLASGAENGEIAIWEPATGKRLKSFHDPKGLVRNLTWSPDGKKLATGGVNTITIWNVGTGEQSRELNLNTVALSSLAWSPDGSTLASISYEGTPILWDPFTSNQFRILPTKYGNQNSAWSPRGDLLGISNESGVVEVTLWNPQTGEAELTHKRVQDLAWSPLADIVASISDNGTGYGGDDTTVVLWDPRTGEEVRSFNVGALLHDLDWSPDGEYLVASAGYSLMVLDAVTGEQLHNFKGHYNVATRVTWSPRGDFIASTAPDGTIIIWRIGQ